MKTLLIIVTVGVLAACAGTSETGNNRPVTADPYFGSIGTVHNLAMQQNLVRSQSAG